MSATDPGALTISCPTVDGTLSVTATFDPETGAFAPEAIRCFGSDGTGQVGILDSRTGSTHYFLVRPSEVITDTMLTSAGITKRYQIQSLSLALVQEPQARPNGAKRRCGWNVSQSTRVGDWGRALVRISSDEGLSFYLPQELYEDLDDEAFLALCKAKRERG